MSGPTLPSEPQVRCPHCPEMHPQSYPHCPNTGKSLSTGSALIGRVIAGRYRIVGQLGEGGMGEVFVAEHLMIGRKVAIKRLHPELVSDERAVQRFQREARAAAATGHEHIVEVLDLGYADDNAPYLVMEYLRGQSLADVIKREGRLTPQRACNLLIQVLAALEAVHRLEIVHRDLKPDNIFITRRPGLGEFVKVLDFGISKMKEENGEALHLTRTGMMMGTPFYMSPEQARGVRDVDHRVDLYAVGVLLYECLTGRLPFSSDNYHALLQQILRSEPRKPSDFAPLVDPALDEVALRSIGKDPALRFGSAAEFAAALAPFRGSATSVATSRADVATPGMGRDQLQPVQPPSPAPRAEPVPQEPVRQEPARQLLTLAEARPVTEALPAPVRTQSTPLEVGPRNTPRYYFAASDDWQPDRARGAGLRSPDIMVREPAWPPSPGGAAALKETMERLERLAREAPARPPASEPTVIEAGLTPLTPTLARSEAALRGAWFVGAIEHLESTRGPEALGALAARLPRDAAERVQGVILPMAWLPLATFELLLLAAGGEGVAQAIGRAIADRELSTTHRLFVQTATPHAGVQRFPHLFKLYHLRGAATIDEADPQGVRFSIDIGSPEPPAHCQVVSAFLQRLIETCGGREVRCAVVGCRGRGDPRTLISCRFR